MVKLNHYNLLFVTALLFSTLVAAQETEKSTNSTFESEEAKLAKATQNPVAAMYSIPFQNNSTFNVGPKDRTQNILNIQPVIPISLSEGLNLINRVILPVITQPYGDNGMNSSTGIGDISYTAFVSPKKAEKIIWGAGPVIQIPTASSADEFGSREFGLGPSLVALKTIDKWVAGFIINNIWTFGNLKENKFLFQYFINYNLPKAVYLVSAPILTANWNAESGQQWIVPFGGGIGKVFKLGKQPINVNAQGYYNAVKPDGWGDWQVRIQLQLLFPKKSK
ncbi:hypothetical protein LCM02_10955 [Lutimonas saemankumensis]|uniref:hypothetical protein n=1 Tax=Lutimonas saemankumensis TaxID=483016 RepID=UPI001CD365C3|nr:hypothetical protein [Lutimonas saemankumensis]MCA0932971.1 hypothetical protein [Lutimonas saemankumensis]